MTKLEVDFDRALLLLTVVEKALAHPKLRPIVDTASAELDEMCKPEEEPASKVVEVEEPEPKEDKPVVGRRL